MPRQYTKRNLEYWESRKNDGAAYVEVSAPQSDFKMPDINYAATHISTAAIAPVGVSSRGVRTNQPGTALNAFENIKAMPLPWQNYNGNREYTGISDAIDLCSRAYCGVPIVRNAIEVAVEFSSQPLYIKSDNQTVKTFFEEWLQAAQINKLKQQFFREYYRSGNVFLYKFSGKFGASYYKNFQTSFAAKENRIPIRYELLNPSNVFVPTGIAAPYSYVRLLSTYEIERLRHPITEQDKQVLADLPKQIRMEIEKTATFPLGLYIPLDPERLRFAFYKKQGYEPLAVPMVYPVLPLIEWKLSLQKMDKFMSNLIEQILLLVTMGESPSKENGGNGLNQNNMVNLRNVLANPSVSRVIVADWTVKAEWKVPDLSALGPEKYQIVNEDIREGLQSILTGDDKFANAQIKAKIFIQRLQEGQNEFLQRFLLPEIQQICDTMGFRTIPEVGFQEMNLQDETVLDRIYAQLGQMGVLTPKEIIKAIETGILPDEGESLKNQEELKKLRDKGLYMPATPGQQSAGQGGRPAGTTGIPQTTKKISPVGTTSGSETKFSMTGLIESMKETEAVEEKVLATLKKKFKVKELNDAQKNVAHILTKSIITIYPRGKWHDMVKASVDAPPLIPNDIASEIVDICNEYKVDDWQAAILRHSKL